VACGPDPAGNSFRLPEQVLLRAYAVVPPDDAHRTSTTLSSPTTRPDSPANVPGDPRRFANLAGVARKG